MTYMFILWFPFWSFLHFPKLIKLQTLFQKKLNKNKRSSHLTTQIFHKSLPTAKDLNFKLRAKIFHKLLFHFPKNKLKVCLFSLDTFVHVLHLQQFHLSQCQKHWLKVTSYKKWRCWRLMLMSTHLISIYIYRDQQKLQHINDSPWITQLLLFVTTLSVSLLFGWTKLP